MGKIIGIIFGAIALIAVVFLGIKLIDIDQTEAGELPSVDVDVQADAGQLPEFDVDTGEVVVGTTTETVLVPKVEMVEEEIEVPVVGIQEPEDDSEE